MLGAPEPGVWRVVRQGRPNARPRLLYIGHSEDRARQVYHRASLGVRQGVLELQSPAAEVVAHVTAPMVRTRW